MPSKADCTNWTAEDQDELIQVWRDLVGDREVSEDYLPIYRGEEIEPREAGYVFQTWIVEALRLSGATVDSPFSIPINPGTDNHARHEIDGLLCCDWRGFLIESKFQQVDFSPIARLHLIAEGCPAGTMGLFFAAKGFTGPTLEAAHILRPMRVLLFDHADIECCLNFPDGPNLLQGVHAKWKSAIRYGRPNFALAEL